MTDETIAKNVNRLKKQRKMTLASLSETSGVPVGTLARIVSGKVAVSAENLRKLAQALGCRAEELMLILLKDKNLGLT